MRERNGFVRCLEVEQDRFEFTAKNCAETMLTQILKPGMMAAAASAALDYSVPRMPQVHELTKRTATTLETYGYKFCLPVQTNMIILDLERSGLPPAAFVDYCKKEGVIVFPSGRLVFHYQTTQEGVDKLLRALKNLKEDKTQGKELSARKVVGGYT